MYDTFLWFSLFILIAALAVYLLRRFLGWYGMLGLGFVIVLGCMFLRDLLAGG